MAAAEDGQVKEVEDLGAEGGSSVGVDEEGGVVVKVVVVAGIMGKSSLTSSSGGRQGQQQRPLTVHNALALQHLPGVSVHGCVGNHDKGPWSSGLAVDKCVLDMLFGASLVKAAIFVGLIGREGSS